MEEERIWKITKERNFGTDQDTTQLNFKFFQLCSAALLTTG